MEACMSEARSSTQILQDILRSPGVTAAVIVGRDGFGIESAGSLRSVNIDLLGASVAMILSGTERMGTEMNLTHFSTLTLEFADAMVMCQPIADALLVILSPDSKTLGMIRLQVKKFLPELEKLF
jgi:predicted regulator of Ras-like GTPase activity (Roadblock/LC7/MglB family)